MGQVVGVSEVVTVWQWEVLLETKKVMGQVAVVTKVIIISETSVE